MAGPWLYAISEGSGRNFYIDGESIKVTVSSYRELLEDGRLDKDSWRFVNHGQHAEVGDDVLIYTGDQKRGIIGYAKIESKGPFIKGWSLKLGFNRSKSLMLLEECPMPPSVVETWGVKSLRGNLIDLGQVAPAREEIVDLVQLHEGALRTITVNAYERNPEARRLCIKHYGRSCFICKFKFGEVYGEVVEDLIHVHHLRQLAKIRRQYVVDPINDLRPVCPNCHAVLHQRYPEPYSIEEVRAFLRSKGSA